AARRASVRSRLICSSPGWCGGQFTFCRSRDLAEALPFPRQKVNCPRLPPRVPASSSARYEETARPLRVRRSYIPPTPNPLSTARMYGRDLRASLCVAGLLLPEAVAYAAIAGLPAQSAILAAIAGALVYAIAGRSRFAVIAPTSSSAAILGAALPALSPDAGER